VIDQVGGDFRHAPGVAQRAEAAPLAGEGHQEILAARGAAGAGEAVGHDSVFQVASQFGPPISALA